VTLDASDEEFIGISIRILHKVWRRLFGRNSDEGYSLVGGLEPYYLRSFDLAARFVTTIALAFTAFGFLFFFGGGRGRSKEAKCTRE
jgi:hypothetical protein